MIRFVLNYKVVDSKILVRWQVVTKPPKLCSDSITGMQLKINLINGTGSTRRHDVSQLNKIRITWLSKMYKNRKESKFDHLYHSKGFI